MQNNQQNNEEQQAPKTPPPPPPTLQRTSSERQKSSSQQYTTIKNNRKSYHETQNNKLCTMLNSFKDGNVSMEDLVNVVTFREKIPEVPYFRQTRSGAISCHGVKREPIVLYRDQWLRFGKTFNGGENSVFNNFFKKKDTKNH